MSDQVPHRETDRWLEPGELNIKAIYILYAAGLVVGITALAGIVIAYMNRGKSEAWVETHYTWAIRTFWIGLLYALISAVTMIVAVGFLLGLATTVWFIARLVIGWQRISRREPIASPDSWLF
jgi:uncharacterized membrane protein